MIPIYAPLRVHSTGQAAQLLEDSRMPKMIARSFRVSRDAARAFIYLTNDKGREYEFEISEQALPALGRHLAEVFGLVPMASPPQSSDTAAQILSFQCECDSEGQLVVLRFEASNRTPTVVTLTVPRAQEVFESIGKALTVIKSEPPATRQ
jgi:hypothetical protein